MNPISLAMDGLLAVLLTTAVAVGVRLNGKLKLLREGQGQFVRAVGDLDAAAGRAESGLVALRTATEEAHDALLSRIETARALLPKLDRAAEQGAAVAARLDQAVHAAADADRRVRSTARAAEAAPPRRAANAARPAAEPIPFPGLRRDPAERGLAAALRTAERIVEAETDTDEAALPAAVFAPEAEPVRSRERVTAPPPAGAAGDRLARFVARRRSARG